MISTLASPSSPKAAIYPSAPSPAATPIFQDDNANVCTRSVLMRAVLRRTAGLNAVTVLLYFACCSALLTTTTVQARKSGSNKMMNYYQGRLFGTPQQRASSSMHSSSRYLNFVTAFVVPPNKKNDQLSAPTESVEIPPFVQPPQSMISTDIETVPPPTTTPLISSNSIITDDDKIDNEKEILLPLPSPLLPDQLDFDFVPKTTQSLRAKLNISPDWINKYDAPSSSSMPSSSASSVTATTSSSFVSNTFDDDSGMVKSNCRPWIVGHRGALYCELENTKESFLSSFAMGSDAVELDVFLLKDNTLIVFHGGGTDENPGDLSDYCIQDNFFSTDSSTSSSSSFTNSNNILDLDYSQCQQLVFNPLFEEFPCDKSKIVSGKIPTLEEVLLDAKMLKKHVKIELKGPGTVEPVLELVDELNMVDLCSFSSFYHDRLALIRQLRPQINDVTGEYIYKTGALFDEVPDDFLTRAMNVGASEVHLRYDTCTVGRINAIHKAGMGSMAWFRGPIGMHRDTTEKYNDVGNEDESMYCTVLATGVQQMCINKPNILAAMYEEKFDELIIDPAMDKMSSS